MQREPEITDWFKPIDWENVLAYYPYLDDKTRVIARHHARIEACTGGPHAAYYWIDIAIEQAKIITDLKCEIWRRDAQENKQCRPTTKSSSSGTS